jgi:hypothetical protein
LIPSDLHQPLPAIHVFDAASQYVLNAGRGFLPALGQRAATDNLD